MLAIKKKSGEGVGSGQMDKGKWMAGRLRIGIEIRIGVWVKCTCIYLIVNHEYLRTNTCIW